MEKKERGIAVRFVFSFWISFCVFRCHRVVTFAGRIFRKADFEIQKWRTKVGKDELEGRRSGAGRPRWMTRKKVGRKEIHIIIIFLRKE